ncbi:hypothetical protein BOTBODRAFT_179818 [Botryobasidium botryosum FD-172 SS1]|uniref:Uncharacterized protein n=1 Tax=Botryobasidium botryosum (strain FD-172 SS1) TaxID=930990 RepID=A0A067M9C5_BOTB1|nr:hypothetical protein BOTBODRAFT_179818 [Botryobasidium botryosum FD-172 SS1]
MAAPPPSAPPPTYSDQAEPSHAAEPQLLIAPTIDAVNFQNGYLGAEGEHAALEGEVQIKGARNGEWDSVSITFETTETTPLQTIRLNSFTCKLFSSSSPSSSSANPSAIPFALPFSIPLTSDTPHPVQTPYSSLTHSLIATLHPAVPSRHAIIKSIPVQIQRYTSASSIPLSIAPAVVFINSPTTIKAEIPRATYTTGEPIPVYFTISTPDPSVVREGLRLRNIKAELVRDIKIGTIADEEQEKPDVPMAVEDEDIPEHSENMMHSTVITRSGASCRFHPTRPIRLRLVLHPSNAESALGITQSTLLHQTNFYVQFDISFFSTSGPTGSQVQSSISASSTFPIVILPPPAPAPGGGFGEDVDTAYRKKYDRPPTKTNRSIDDGPSGGPPPPFDEPGTPAESVGPNAPPPFFPEPPTHPPTFMESEASSSYAAPAFADRSDAGGSQLPPSFLESESDALQPSFQPSASSPSSFAEWAPRVQGQPELELRFAGEGVGFGFVPSDQFDGLSHSYIFSPQEERDRSRIQMEGIPQALGDALEDGDMDVNELAGLIQPIVLGDDGRPPPPPPMDDPMDLPPTIDELLPSLSLEERERRVALGESGAGGQAGPHLDLEALPSPSDESSRSTTRSSVHAGHGADDGGPPPYLNPVSSLGARHGHGHGHGQALGSGPPPYMDLRP